MKLNKGIQRRTIAYFTVTTLLMILATTMITVDLPRALNNRDWRNAPGNVTIGTVTTYWQHFSINPANNDERHAFTLARDENGEATVKGMPMKLFVYGVGEDFQFPEGGVAGDTAVSAEVRLYVSSFFGDSISPSHLSVYPLNKVLDISMFLLI